MGMQVRVAIIDDDASFRYLVLSMLKGEFETTSACDGVEGLAMLLANPPDVAVLDVQMPRLDGLGVLRAIRAHPILQNLPVLMLTGDASRETVIAAISAGANDYIIKIAFNREELHRKIRRALKLDTPAFQITPAAPPAADVSPALAASEETQALKDAELQAVLDGWE